MSQITTHVLDTAQGCPAAGIPITLCKLDGSTWQNIGQGVTDNDGRVGNLCAQDQVLAAGTYRMQFDTEQYLRRSTQNAFYPWADVVFNIGGDGQHYHIPLLLSPYGYSTYRGS